MRKQGVASFFRGLGDELQFSTLPEELSKLGHEPYLYEGNLVKPFRNSEIKEFVWGKNPYLKEPPPMGERTWDFGDLPDRKYEEKTGVFIKNWEVANGLPGKNIAPKIYHKPNIIRGLGGVIELSSITLKYQPQLIKQLVKEIIHEFRGFHFKQIVSGHQTDRIHIPQTSTHEISSLFEAWDLICSCKVFISLNSGLHSVSAAAREHNPTMLNYCVMPKADAGWIMEQKKFVYEGVKYLAEGENF